MLRRRGQTRYKEGPRLPTFHALGLRADERWSFRRVPLVTCNHVKHVCGRSYIWRYEWGFPHCSG